MKSSESVIPEGLTNGQRHRVGSGILHGEKTLFDDRHLRVAKEAQAAGDLRTADDHAQLWLQGKMDTALQRVINGVGIALLVALGYATGANTADHKASKNHDEIASCLEDKIAGNNGGSHEGGVTAEQLYDCGAGYSGDR